MGDHRGLIDTADDVRGVWLAGRRLSSSVIAGVKVRMRMSGDHTMLGPGVHEAEALQALEDGDVDTARVRAVLAQAAAVSHLAAVVHRATAPKFEP